MGTEAVILGEEHDPCTENVTERGPGKHRAGGQHGFIGPGQADHEG
ncbi:hypothetical protein [Arthrobacter sp. CG_A4]|nr:hypothetical protein [Arthrobacter sp. CG_A4]